MKIQKAFSDCGRFQVSACLLPRKSKLSCTPSYPTLSDLSQERGVSFSLSLLLRNICGQRKTTLRLRKPVLQSWKPSKDDSCISTSVPSARYCFPIFQQLVVRNQKLVAVQHVVRSLQQIVFWSKHIVVHQNMELFLVFQLCNSILHRLRPFSKK